MSTKRNPRISGGQARQSQVVTTYGPGALVDLADHSVIIGGLETWRGEGELVSEERLRAKLREQLKTPHLEMRAPPRKRETDDGPETGLGAFVFPQWFVVQEEVHQWGGVARRFVHLKALDGGKFPGGRNDRGRALKLAVTPTRFVQACTNGHISDIDWRAFVHGDLRDCFQQLWLIERGTTGDLASVQVLCECGSVRTLGAATLQEQGGAPLGMCKGEQPWLGRGPNAPCAGANGKPLANKFLVRHATNAWFGATSNVIHIPDRQAALRKAIESVADDGLANVTSPDELAMLRKLVSTVKAALEGFDSADVFVELQRRKGLAPPQQKKIKELELETLLGTGEEIGDDLPDGDFYARRLQLPAGRSPEAQKVSRVVLVHRLREVQALVGFTRFEPPTMSFDGELDLPVTIAPLARELRWVPAVENRGEGVLVVLDKAAVEAWSSRPAVVRRGAELLDGFRVWQQAEPSRANVIFPGSRFILLHSLSHLLLTAMSLECGYSASSIRERIYSLPDVGYAILLYTGTPDAEGTLGGLVLAGRQIERHLENALELGRLCSYDPVCAQHKPDSREEDRHLHGAACHGCLLIAETSCEHRNLLLDRALVVPTVDCTDAAFFGSHP